MWKIEKKIIYYTYTEFLSTQIASEPETVNRLNTSVGKYNESYEYLLVKVAGNNWRP